MKQPQKYKKARLVIPDAGAKNQRWYIVFWVWDINQGKLIRRYDTTMNSIQDLRERKLYSSNLVREINSLLAKNYVAGEDPQAKQGTEVLLSMNELIAEVLKAKKNLKHFRDYEQKLGVLSKWLASNGLKEMQVTAFSSHLVRKFISDIASEKNIGIRTQNNYLATLSMLFNYAKDHHEYLDIKNPVESIDKKRNPLGKNLAFSQDEQTMLMEFMMEKYPWLALFCTTMFYTLARTNELAQLRISMVGKFDKGKIFFPADIVKNGHVSGISKNVTMPKQLQEWFDLYEIKSYPPDYFLFGKEFKPSKTPYNSRYMGARFRELVLDKFNFSTDYTLYSWKATGTSMYLLNGVSPGALMLQGGWKDPNSFRAYIKSIGALDNPEIIDRAPQLGITPQKP
ncbi:MAG: tyrosine-type recombinase/integrase [Bacteroidia bacterium]|nr:tyrosine-type recombinase/integrase [Bacteroidia bacterium]